MDNSFLGLFTIDYSSDGYMLITMACLFFGALFSRIRFWPTFIAGAIAWILGATSFVGYTEWRMKDMPQVDSLQIIPMVVAICFIMITFILFLNTSPNKGKGKPPQS